MPLFVRFLSFYSLVTGNRADEEVDLYSANNVWHVNISLITGENITKNLSDLMQTVDRLIETGQSEQIFKEAIQEQGRGQVG